MSLAGDLSFLSNSIQHKSIAGINAERDVNNFVANTPALQEAVRYWKTPVKSTEATVAEETRLLNQYEREIRIVQSYLWEVHIARVHADRQNEPPSLLGKTFTVVSTTVNSILPSTQKGRQTLEGIIYLVVGVVSVFFVLITPPIPCTLFKAAIIISLATGIYLISTARNMQT